MSTYVYIYDAFSFVSQHRNHVIERTSNDIERLLGFQLTRISTFENCTV